MKLPSLHRFREQLPPSWQELLSEDLHAEYFKSIHRFLKSEYSTCTIYPRVEKIFRAFSLTEPGSVSVVILGQDPYQGDDEADGLAFSCSVKPSLPPSLRNIFMEIDPGFRDRLTGGGDLSCWARQGVLLLNTILTVRKDSPGSHKNIGWEIFTDSVIKKVSDSSECIVFMLWGNYAAQKKALVDCGKHLVLTSSHPSPFSVNRSFKGCGHFYEANRYLKINKKNTIRWDCPFSG